MSADIVKTRIIPATGQEVISIMDDLGTEYVLQIPVSDAVYRDVRIQAAIAQQTANEARVHEYATTHGIDISAEVAAGLIRKTNAKKVTK